MFHSSVNWQNLDFHKQAPKILFFALSKLNLSLLQASKIALLSLIHSPHLVVPTFFKQEMGLPFHKIFMEVLSRTIFFVSLEEFNDKQCTAKWRAKAF